MSAQPSGESLGTVQRVVETIRFFAEHNEATLKEVSLGLGLAPGTCHRLLELLGRDGFIEKSVSRGRYGVGREFFRIAAHVQSKRDIGAIALPFLRRLVDACDETCVLSLYLPSDDKMFFAAKVDPSTMLRYQLPMNTPMSLLWGASGRTILAYLDKKVIDRMYRAEGTAPASGDPLPARWTLDKDLSVVRMRGYELTQGQRVTGAVGISAPVFGIDGKVIGCICATVPKARIVAKDHPRLAQLVVATTGQMSAALGAPVNNRAKSGIY